METFVGDTVNIVLKTSVDLTGYSDLFIKFKRPDGTTGWWDATISALDDTWMEYLTEVTDIDQPGVWAIQSHAEAMGVVLHGKWANFTAYVPLPETTTPPTTVAPTTAP